MADIRRARRRAFRIAVFAFFFFLPFSAGAEIVFSDLDLSSGNRLLFRAAGSAGGAAPVQDALFIASLPGAFPDSGPTENRPQQLSAFPEKIDLIENGRALRIRNAFGAARIPLAGGLPTPIPGLPSFAGGDPAAAGRIEETLPSGDGRWLLYLDPVSPARGNLIVLDALSGTKTQAASRLDRPEKTFPAAWSPDSRFFIYERAGKLYYCAVGAPGARDERARLIGDGTIKSIRWGRGGDFYYLRGSTLYLARSEELFARAMYADFLEIGAAAGELPFEFDPEFDEFWAAPDGRSLLVSKGRRSLFYFPVGAGEKAGAEGTPLPYLLLPRFCSEISVLWSQAGTATAIVSVPKGAGVETKNYRLNVAGAEGSFELLPPPGPGAGAFSSASLSPDGKLALFWGEGGILLYDYANWKLLDALGARPGKACVWTGNEEFVAGDDCRIERFVLVRGAGSAAAAASGTGRSVVARRELICLSGAERAVFEEGGARVLAKSGGAWYASDGKSPWRASANPRPGNPSPDSGRFRVYLEPQDSGLYANLPMIRSAGSVGTVPLFPPGENPGAAAPRAGPRKAALCFDLYDDDWGLPETLDALRRAGVKATFFLNGEFIRRHPLAAAAIAESGHEAASLFFAPIDLSDARYRPGSDFIPRGLARNEDEYYRATGKELSLLWHPPRYPVSPDIAAAAAKAGYITSGRDVDPMDWVSREEAENLGIPQLSPSEMIERVIGSLKPGSVIPVRLGRLSGGRSGYLYNRVNALIDALLREGYELATVSQLIGNAK